MTTENTNNDDLLTNAGFIECQAALSKAFDIFVEATKKAVSPTTFDSKAQWAVSHDDNWDYNADIVLNTDKLDKLNDDYWSLMNKEGYAQQVLRLMTEAIPTNEDERKIKEREIAYIRTWLELIHAFYANFLAGVTIDKEDFDDKYVRVRGELINRTNKMIIHDYVDYMKEHEEWGSEDVERFLAGDDPFAVIPESFAQSYYDDLDLLE